MITRSVLTVDLRDDPAAIESYREHHERVWPEVLASLRAAGVRDMNIYLHGRRLVMVVDTEGQDFRSCFAVHATSHPRVIEWEALMRTLQQSPPGTPRGDWWAQMEPVFSLGGTGSTTPELHASPRN
jgi:L-rhamnose mutarotase